MINYMIRKYKEYKEYKNRKLIERKEREYMDKVFIFILLHLNRKFDRKYKSNFYKNSDLIYHLFKDLEGLTLDDSDINFIDSFIISGVCRDIKSFINSEDPDTISNFLESKQDRVYVVKHDEFINRDSYFRALSDLTVELDIFIQNGKKGFDL